MSSPFENLEVSSKIYKVYPHDEMYHKLERIYGNRTVLPYDVLQIKESIEKNNLLHLQPIIVQVKDDGTIIVVDGQHRLAAIVKARKAVRILLGTSIRSSVLYFT